MELNRTIHFFPSSTYQVTEIFTFRAQQTRQGFVGQTQTAAFSAQVRELDPHFHIFPWADNQRSHFQDTLPNFHISLGTFQPASICPLATDTAHRMEAQRTLSSTSFVLMPGGLVDRITAYMK